MPSCPDEVAFVDRLKLQQLALARRDDAEALLDKGRWSAASYLIGYAVECGLKACVLKHLGESDAVFGGDGKYLTELAKCWTHDLVKLVNLAGLTAPFGLDRSTNPALDVFWDVVRARKETSRYEERTEPDARKLYEAVTNSPDGVFLWIQSRW